MNEDERMGWTAASALEEIVRRHIGNIAVESVYMEINGAPVDFFAYVKWLDESFEEAVSMEAGRRLREAAMGHLYSAVREVEKEAQRIAASIGVEDWS